MIYSKILQQIILLSAFIQQFTFTNQIKVKNQGLMSSTIAKDILEGVYANTIANGKNQAQSEFNIDNEKLRLKNTSDKEMESYYKAKHVLDDTIDLICNNDYILDQKSPNFRSLILKLLDQKAQEYELDLSSPQKKEKFTLLTLSKIEKTCSESSSPDAIIDDTLIDKILQDSGSYKNNLQYLIDHATDNELTLAKKIFEKIKKSSDDQCTEQLASQDDGLEETNENHRDAEWFQCKQNTVREVWQEVALQMKSKVVDNASRRTIKALIRQKIDKLYHEYRKQSKASKKNYLDDKEVDYTNVFGTFDSDEKVLLDNGDLIDKQIETLTEEIIKAENYKQQWQTEKKTQQVEIEKNVNRLIAKKYVLQAVQREQSEWAVKRTRLENLQKEQFKTLMESYNKKKVLLQDKINVLEKTFRSTVHDIKKTTKHEMKNMAVDANNLVSQSKNIAKGLIKVESAVKKGAKDAKMSGDEDDYEED